MSCEPERSCTAHSVLPQPIIPFGNPGPCTPCKVPTCPSVAGSRQQPAASSQRRPHSMGSYSCFGKDKMVPPATKGLLECDARGQEGARGDLKTASRMQAAGPPHREGWRISQAQEQEGCTHRVTQMARWELWAAARPLSRIALAAAAAAARADAACAQMHGARRALQQGRDRAPRQARHGRAPPRTSFVHAAAPAPPAGRPLGRPDVAISHARRAAAPGVLSVCVVYHSRSTMPR